MNRFFGVMTAACVSAALVTACGSRTAATETKAETGTVAQTTEQAATELAKANANIQVKTFTAHQATMYVKNGAGTGANVREYPSVQAGVKTFLKNGEQVEAVGSTDGWTDVVISGEHCYIASGLLSEKKADETAAQTTAAETAAQTKAAEASSAGQGITVTDVSLSSDMKYAEFSKIHTGTAKLYKNNGGAHGKITVCVNAGHGTRGGESVKTQSHPDGTGKVTGGTNANGAVTSMAVSSGMEFADGTAERKITLKEALVLKQKLLDLGYSVLMIRESDDIQLDNIARSVLANNYANCHVAIHWDSTSSDKGAYFMSPPAGSFRQMEPVAATWQKDIAFGSSLISGLKSAGIKIFGDGSMEADLTQTSYSSVPSVDIELGDKVSDHSDAALDQLASGLAAGINAYFGN